MAQDKETDLGRDLNTVLSEWFRTIPGSVLQAQEHEALERLLPALFGYYALQIESISATEAPLQGWRIGHRFLIQPEPKTNLAMAQLVADPLQLPVATDSIDAVLLPHSLDFSADPHQLLREVERVLIPDGRVLIVGFNMCSLWGIRRLFTRRHSALPWCGRFLTPHRMKDWLSLLGFEVEHQQMMMFRPPLQHGMLMSRLAFMESLGRRYWPMLGGVYVIQAVKRESLVRPLRRRWKATRTVLVDSALTPRV